MSSNSRFSYRGPARTDAFVAPAPGSAAWNEEMVRRYDIERYYQRAHPLVRWVEERRMTTVLKLASVEPGDRVLEVGCGAGHVLARIGGATCVGVDLSPTMLERARRRVRDASLVQGSAEGLPFENGAFDVVICTEVLEHLLRPTEALKELIRVVSATGRVVVSVPNETMIDRMKTTAGHVYHMRPVLKNLADTANEWHLHRLNAEVLRGLCGGVAQVRRIRAVPFRALPLRYAALLRPLGGRGERLFDGDER